MKHKSKLIPPKRVPYQYHLSLWAQSWYKGLPVLCRKEGLVCEYLDKIHSVLIKSLEQSSKVFVVRVDLSFPQYFYAIGEEQLSNASLNLFIKNFRYRLGQYAARKRQLEHRVYSVDFDYVWARESGDVNCRPHYHLLLLFNGHEFNSLGRFSCHRESLYNRLGDAWGYALGLREGEGAKYIYIPDGGQYMIGSSDPIQMERVFYRASYLAKVETKDFKSGFHVFGGSRV